MPKRLVIIVVLAALGVASAFWFLRRDESLPEGSLTQQEMAAAVGGPVMLNLVRGHVPGRSGEIMLVPKPNNFMISEWDLRTLEGDSPEIKTTHPGPWAYLARVPIVVRGPGVPEGVRVRRPVDITSIAPTYARVLGMDDFTSTSEPLTEVLDEPVPPPRAIVTVVLDGGGWNLLDRYPDAWPNIKSLMDEGVTYDGATIGSAPSTTGALHATFGTGFYPMDHGIPGNVLRDDDGSIVDVFYGKDSDLKHLKKPTVSELWDERNDNEPVVGTVSIENWHLGMIGKGALRDGGDRDLGAFWNREQEKWEVNPEYFELPPRLAPTRLDRLSELEAQLDGRDGTNGDGWFGNDIAEVVANKNSRPASPAFTRFMGEAVVDVMRDAEIGTDGVTDLFWIELKMPDSAGHAWNMLFPELKDVLEQTDAEVGRFVDDLDRRLGRDNYLFTLTADHGQQPIPQGTDGWRINTGELERDLVARFGAIVDDATPADLYLDADALASAGVGIEEVAGWIGAYTIADNIPEDAPGRDLVPEELLDDTLYAAAFTTDFLANPPADLRGLGPGDYGDEGRLPVVYNVGE